MEYPFFIFDAKQASAIYSIQKLLHYYHIKEETKNIKDSCGLYDEHIDTETILSCLHQYSIVAKEISLDMYQLPTPCIILCHGETRYLFLYKRSKKYVTVYIAGTGKCKRKFSDIETLYTGSCIKILHVGRLKKTVSYTTFGKFYKSVFNNHKKQFLRTVKLTLLYTLLLISLTYFIIYKYIFTSILHYFIVLLLMNIILCMQYMQKNQTLQLIQNFFYEYGHKKIKQMIVNETSCFKSEHIMKLVEDIVIWYKVCTIDIIVWLAIFIALAMRYPYIVTAFNIVFVCLIVVCPCKYQYDNQHKYICKSMFPIWDTYIKCKNELYQMQLHDSFINNIDTQFASIQKDYIVKERKRYRYVWLLNMSLGLFICCVFMLEKYIPFINTSFWYHLSGAMLFIMQCKMILNIMSVVNRREATYQAFTMYNQFDDALIRGTYDTPITSIDLYHIRNTKLQYIDLHIHTSMCLFGNEVEIKNIFHIVVGKVKDYKGSIYVNGQLVTKQSLLNIQTKIILLEKDSFILNEYICYQHIISKVKKEPNALFLLQLFNIEAISAKLNIEKGTLTLSQKQILMFIRAIVLKPDMILLYDALSEIDVKVYEKISIYLQTCLPNTIVVIYDSLQRRLPFSYEKVTIISGN